MHNINFAGRGEEKIFLKKKVGPLYCHRKYYDL
jgi:hypothetical protein